MKMVKCPQCKGKKQIPVEVIEIGKTRTSQNITLNCITCKGEGEITSQREQELKEEAKLWCKCKESTFGSYPEDGQCNCGVYKHHVHCGTCGKISQMG